MSGVLTFACATLFPRRKYIDTEHVNIHLCFQKMYFSDCIKNKFFVCILEYNIQFGWLWHNEAFFMVVFNQWLHFIKDRERLWSGLKDLVNKITVFL